MTGYLRPFVGSGNVIDWLFGMDRVSWGDPRAVLSWQYPLEAWHWVTLVLAAILCSAATYRHLLGPRYARTVLTVLRALIILVVVALLLGPMVRVLNTKTKKDWLVILVDRSESMTINDARPVDADPAADPISRDAALRSGLLRYGMLFAEERFLCNRHLLWLGFDEVTYAIEAPTAEGVHWDKPEGQVTALRTALDHALRRTAGRPIGGIVLLTDGRSAQSTGAKLVRRLNQRGARVFPVLIGGDIQLLDLAVARVDAPKKAFVNDEVPVRVWIELNPDDAEIEMPGLELRLVDAQTEKVIDETSVDLSALDKPITLAGRSAAIGPTVWRVELADERPGNEAHTDQVQRNNQRVLNIELIDQPVRVLYVEGQPRWQYRYLKNLLVREKSIASSMMLLSADRQFAQEGDEPIARLPTSPQEWEPFDVIILGDVPSETMSHDQLTMLRDHVAVRGAGLIWIGGPTSMPRRFDATVLADLLPMRRPGAVGRADDAGAYSMHPTPAARALNVLQLRDPMSGTADESIWPNLPLLHWVQDLGPLKQIADVLATSAADSHDPTALPLVVRMRYGAGQSVYVATDETWRFRYGQGGLFFTQFWTDLVRMLGRHRIQQHSESIRLELGHRRVELGQTVVVDLTLEDGVLVNRDLPRIAVAVYREGDDQQQHLERLVLLPRSDQVGLESVVSVGAHYRAMWRPSTAGRLLLRVVEPALDDLGITKHLEVVRPDAELRHTRPDRQRLAALAEQTGVKKVYRLEQLEQLAQDIDSRAESTDDDQTEPLWNSPLALMVVLVLLTVEWVGRKLIRLL